MKKIVLCLLFTLIVYVSAYAEYHGVPMYCRVQIESRDKENVIRQIIKDMNEEGYNLIQRSSVFLVFEAPLRRSNRFNYATTFGQSWKGMEFSPPVYQLNVTVVRKTTSSVEVEITPKIILNPNSSRQAEIYEDYIKTRSALNEYLISLKEIFERKI